MCCTYFTHRSAARQPSERELPSPSATPSVRSGRGHSSSGAIFGARIRVIWDGAEYRGRFREVIWDGSAKFTGNSIKRAMPINFLNRDKALEQTSRDTLEWKSLTTGNFSGFDAWLNNATDGNLIINTPLVSCELPIADIDLQGTHYDASGELHRGLHVFRLPEDNPHRSFEFDESIQLAPKGDNPIFIRVTTEDGTRAWTSPIYVYR